MPLSLEFNPYFRHDSHAGGANIPAEIEGMLPSSASVSQESMRPSASVEQWFTSVTQIFEAESANIEFAQSSYPEHFSELSTRKDLSLSEAIQVASIESAAYITKYPHLPFFAPEFTSCFRLLRTAELTGGMTRGGESFFIGSGATISEVLALYIAPPTDEDLSIMRSNKPDDIELRHDGITRLNLKEPSLIPVLSGHATAIEPDPAFDTMFHLGLKAFPFPDGLLSREQQTLHEALLSGWNRENTVNNIIWYRADPQVLGFNPETLFGTYEESEKQVEGIISSFFLLFQRLQEDGAFGMTVGAGNSTEDRIMRLQFIKTVRELLKIFPLEEKKDISGFYLADNITAGMFAEPVGSVAGLFLRKTADTSPPTSAPQVKE